MNFTALVAFAIALGIVYAGRLVLSRVLLRAATSSRKH
jgi:hypothetical protein